MQGRQSASEVGPRLDSAREELDLAADTEMAARLSAAASNGGSDDVGNARLRLPATSALLVRFTGSRDGFEQVLSWLEEGGPAAGLNYGELEDPLQFDAQQLFRQMQCQERSSCRSAVLRAAAAWAPSAAATMAS